MSKRSGTSTYMVALALFLAGIGYLGFAGLSDGRMPFVNVGEALAAPAGKLDKAKIFGTVAAEGLSFAPDRLGARFRLADKDNVGLTLWVDYQGALPDTFREGAEVVVEGRLQPAGFNATSLITKCPSKYEKENREGRT
jgi:cytochrome c-type biogenesis protein CcmE